MVTTSDIAHEKKTPLLSNIKPKATPKNSYITIYFNQ
jgi:hypothetical protein